jgi:hypothetical protein
MLKAGALVAAASVVLVGCAGVSPTVPVRVQAAGGRFAVSLTRQVLSESTGHAGALRRLTKEELVRIDALLPGPSTTITVTVGGPDQIVSEIGATGFTDPETGVITIGLYRSWSEEPIAISRGLARTLARQVAHSVRITSGPGLGRTLRDQLVADGLATAFDQSAFPGPPDPGMGALTAKQECQPWHHLQPLVAKAGIHGEVLARGKVPCLTFGEPSLPALTGRAIG